MRKHIVPNRIIARNRLNRSNVPVPPQSDTVVVTPTSVSESSVLPPHGNEAMYRQLLRVFHKNRKGKLFPPPNPPLTTTENATVKVNICIPLYNRAKHIQEVLTNIQQIVTATDEKNVKIWIADHHSTDINLQEYIKQFTFEIEIVLFDPPFIIAKCLQITAEHMPKNEIIYFVDADAGLPNVIFQRIRTYVIKNRQFYCPMVSYEQPNGTLQLPPPGKDHGGKGHIGVFLDDFFLCNGWRDSEHLTAIPVPGPGPMTRQKWGAHDGHLYNKLRWDQLNVYRPAEPDQWVKYHARDATTGTGVWFADLKGNKFNRNKK